MFLLVLVLAFVLFDPPELGLVLVLDVVGAGLDLGAGAGAGLNKFLIKMER